MADAVSINLGHTTLFTCKDTEHDDHDEADVQRRQEHDGCHVCPLPGVPRAVTYKQTMHPEAQKIRSPPRRKQL